MAQRELSKSQANVLASLAQQIKANRRWLPLETLDCYDGRTVNALVNRGLVEVNPDYGVRVSA